MRIGHPGSGSVGDFCVQLINALTGAELVPVPYAGAAPAIVALRGEHIEGVVLSLGALSAHIKSGALRGLVASSRFPSLSTYPRCASSAIKRNCSASGSASRACRDPRKCEEGPRRRDRTGRHGPRYHGTIGVARHPAEHATPEQTAAEIRAEFKRVGEMARKTGLAK